MPILHVLCTLDMLSHAIHIHTKYDTSIQERCRMQGLLQLVWIAKQLPKLSAAYLQSYTRMATISELLQLFNHKCRLPKIQRSLLKVLIMGTQTLCVLYEGTSIFQNTH